MSNLQDKREAMESAIRSYFAAVGDGGYLTEFVLFAAGADPQGRGTQYGFWTSKDTPIHHLRGLIALGEEEIYENSTSEEVDLDDD